MLLVGHLAWGANWDSPPYGVPAVPDWRNGPGWPAPIVPARRLNTAFGDTSGWTSGPALSPAAWRVSEIAWRNGDRDFLVVDKQRGRIILFENGRPLFNRPALTGENLADRMPRDEWFTPWSRQNGVKYKVTPAGRFTISRSYDRKLGALFDINELQGRDWTIAIHRVPSERRGLRLRSELVEDKHITNGCIEVDPSTIAQLWRLLPSRALPIYILPNNESLLAELFQPGIGRHGPRAEQIFMLSSSAGTQSRQSAR